MVHFVDGSTRGADAQPASAPLANRQEKKQPLDAECDCWYLDTHGTRRFVPSTRSRAEISHEVVMQAFRFSLILCVAMSPAWVAVAQEKPGPLVVHKRAQLALAGAEVILEAAKKKAEGMGLKDNIAIVDDGGHLLAFARMDGARPASGTTAITKAVSAATFRQETGPLPAKGEPNLLLSLSIQNAAEASGGKITSLKGGVPIRIDDEVIGAVGVGGGTGEQDAEVAKAGIKALLDALDQESRL